MQPIEDPHWTREQYREAQALYAEMKRKIAVLQSLNAQVYSRIRAARDAYQASTAKSIPVSLAARTQSRAGELHLRTRSACN